jgi:hypothetical protein
MKKERTFSAHPLFPSLLRSRLALILAFLSSAAWALRGFTGRER